MPCTVYIIMSVCICPYTYISMMIFVYIYTCSLLLKGFLVAPVHLDDGELEHREEVGGRPHGLPRWRRFRRGSISRYIQWCTYIYIYVYEYILHIHWYTYMFIYTYDKYICWRWIMGGRVTIYIYTLVASLKEMWPGWNSWRGWAATSSRSCSLKSPWKLWWLSLLASGRISSLAKRCLWSSLKHLKAF